jgi:D-threo-aldose 1-dehydrogenase
MVLPNKSARQVIFSPCRDGLRVGLGGAPLGNMFRALAEADAQAVLQAALADGCTAFDTAPHYGQGLSEQRFGLALGPRPRDSFVLSSKVGRVLTRSTQASRNQNGFVQGLPLEQHWDYSASGVRRSVEDSLQRLGLAQMDVAFVHDCDALNHGPRYSQVLRQVVDEALPELHRMRREGLLCHVGLGVNDVQVCLDLLREQHAEAGLDCILLAGRYTLIDQAALPELLPECQARGVRVVLGGVFNSGILATGVRHHAGTPVFNYAAAPPEWIERTAAIEEQCEIHGVPLRAAALQFVLAHPAVELVLAGAQTAEQWQDTRALLRTPIDPAFWNTLREHRLVPAEAPLP